MEFFIHKLESKCPVTMVILFDAIPMDIILTFSLRGKNLGLLSKINL